MTNLPITPVVELFVPDQVKAWETFETAPPYVVTTSTGGAGVWAPTTTKPYYSTKSLQTPTIANGQLADFGLTAPAGTTKVRFWYNVNLGSTDLFRVLVNAVQQLEVVSQADWAMFEYPIAEGQVVTLRYIRNVGGGSNAIWVDSVQFLADEWVDITADVRLAAAHTGGGIRIKKGRPNEGPIAEPTEADIVLNNSGGKWSELNPAGEYYGRLGRNQPMRVSLKRITDGFDRTSVNTWGSTPDWVDAEDITRAGYAYSLVGTAANFDVASSVGTIQAASGSQIAHIGTWADVDVMARVKVSDRTSEFGLMLRTNAAGTQQIRAYITPGATDKAQIARIGSINGWAFASNLATNVVVNTYYWIRGQITGRRYRVKVWKDGDAQPSAWNKTYTDDRVVEVDGTVPSTGGAGLWIKDGTALMTVSSVEYNLWMAHTEVVSFPVEFDLSQQDRWVKMKTRGILQRLGQGRKNLESAVTHHIRQYSTVSAMWHPLESAEGNIATSGISGGRTAKTLGITIEEPDITGAKALPGVSGVAHLTDDTSYFTATAVSYPSTARAWTVLFFFQIDAVVLTESLLATYTSTGTGRTFKLWLQTNGEFRVDVYAADGITILSTNHAGGIGIDEIPAGSWVSSALYVFDSAGTVNWAWNYHRPEPGFSFFTINGSYSGGAGAFRTFTIRSTAVWTAAGGLRIGQVFHYPNDFPFVTYAFSDAACAYRTELNNERFERLLLDAGVKYSFIGQSGDGHQMGPQLPNKLVDLLEECAGVGDFTLEEDRDDLGLILRTRQSIYNGEVFELDVDAGHLSEPLNPAPDDQATRNDVTVARPNGGSARSTQLTGQLNINPPETDPDGVGVYDESVSFNFYEDAQLVPASEWRRTRGTQRVPRYPSLTLDLTAEAYDADPATTARALAIDSGTLLDVVNPKVSPDTLRQLVQSYELFIDQYDLDLTVTSSPAGGYLVGVSGYTTRMSPSGIVLQAPFVVGTDTTMKTRSINSSYTDWVSTATDPDVDNFEIWVAGVQLMVTNVSAPSSNITTLTVTATPTNNVSTGFTIQPGWPINLANPWRTAWEGT